MPGVDEPASSQVPGTSRSGCRELWACCPPGGCADRDHRTRPDIVHCVDARRRRIALAATIPVVVLVGLTLHGLRSFEAYFAADALYAVLAYLLVALAWPRLRPWWPAAIAFGFSAAVELFQLTGIPAELAGRVPVVALALGERFGWLDIAAYACGATAAALVDGAVSRVTAPPAGSDPRGALVLDPGQRLGE